MSIRTSRFGIGRAVMSSVPNLAACVATFSTGWFGTEYLSTDLKGEALVSLALTCLFQIPLAFVILFPPLWLVIVCLVTTTPPLDRLRADLWLAGVVAGAALLGAYFFTDLFQLL